MKRIATMETVGWKPLYLRKKQRELERERSLAIQPFWKMKYILIVSVFVVSALVALSDCACNFTTVRVSANHCLTANNVASDVEFMLPILEDDSAVINFCSRTLLDIKSCIRDAISSCDSNHLVKTVFGGKGAALLAAYEGICAEHHGAEALTCSYPHAHYINAATEKFYEDMDEHDFDNKSDICAPLLKYHEHALLFIEDAAHVKNCSHDSYLILVNFLQTVQFKCMDVATSYYPCTVNKINSNVVQCFAASYVTVRNALVPAPGLAHSDIMCRDTIVNCMKSHLQKCMNEEQAMFLGTGQEYAAAYDCLCALHDADMVLSCPATADTAHAMSTFFSDIHEAVLLGELGKQELCSKYALMKSSSLSAIKTACLDERYQMYWNTFMSTVSYPCTEQRTSCYPHMESGSDPNLSLKFTALFTTFHVFVLSIFA